MANVKVENNRYTVDSLYQWDLNQVLQIYGLSLPSIPEIHFSNVDMVRAIVRQARMDAAGVITVDVPNSVLQNAGKLKVYICDYEGETFRTLYKLEITVKARTKPSDYTLENDPEVYSFNALENRIENVLTEAQSAYTAAATMANRATAAYNTAASDCNTATAAYTAATEKQSEAEEKYNAALETLNGVEDGSVFLTKGGDKMGGVLDMDGNSLTGLPDPVNDTDAVPFKFMGLPLLWEAGNEINTTSIDLDLTPYRFIMLAYFPNTETDATLCTDIIAVGMGKVITVCTHMTNSDKILWDTTYRKVEVSTTGVMFRDSNCLRMSISQGAEITGQYETNNRYYVVPKAIYGIM